jgi:hypothetical protein
MEKTSLVSHQIIVDETGQIIAVPVVVDPASPLLREDNSLDNRVWGIIKRDYWVSRWRKK